MYLELNEDHFKKRDWKSILKIDSENRFWKSILKAYSVCSVYLVGLVCLVYFGLLGLYGSVYSVDKMYLELNEDHFKKKRLKIEPTIQEILDFKVDTLKS